MNQMKQKLMVFLFLLSGMGIYAQILQEKNYIRVDQFGYLPVGKKVAIIAKAINGFNSGTGIDLNTGVQVQLRKASDNSVVFSATATSWNNGNTDSNSGDKGWWFDFSSYTTEGEYYIRATKTGGSIVDSYRFKIASDVYANALKAALNMFYYQRVSQNKTATYASGDKWIDGAWYSGTDQDGNATFLNDNSKHKNVSRGWIDAGDPNKYVTFAADPVHDLLSAYEMNQELFNSFNLNIPESGNNIPDILDEIKWEIDWLINMQDATSGGIHIKAGILNDGGYTSPPGSDSRKRYYGPVCPSSSVIGAGMMAHAALNFKKFSDLTSYSNDLTTRAEKAWTYFENSSDKAATCDDGQIEAGDADGDGNHYSLEWKAEGVCAAVYLYALTGKTKYNDWVKSYYTETRPWKAFDWGVYRSNQAEAIMFYTTLSNADATVKQSIQDKKASSDKSEGGSYMVVESDNLYRARAMYNNWGSNKLIAAQGGDAMDLVEFNIKPVNHDKYKERALGIVNYMHGVNPMGLCMLSNMYQYGADYCNDEMWHTWFNTGTKYDNIDNGNIGPAPGFVTGGPNSSGSSTMKVKVGTNQFTALTKDQPFQKAYSCNNAAIASDAPWAFNEPGLYYNGAYVKLLAHFVSTTVADKVTGLLAPATVNPSKTYEVQVSYTATTSRKIEVTFQLQASPYTNYGYASTTVGAGSGTATLNVAVNASTPIQNNAYQWQSTITTTSGGWNERLDNRSQGAVSCSNVVNESCGLISNNGFENGLNNWTNNGATATVTDKYTGSYASKTGTGQGGMHYKLIPVTAGRIYNLEAYCKVSSSPGWAGIGLTFVDASGTEMTTNKLSLTVLATTYTRYLGSATAPAGAANVRVWTWKNGTVGSLFCDAFCLTETVPAATKYEAENATLIGMTKATSTTGYSGTGYATGMDATGDKVSFSVNVGSAGTYPLTIRYSVCNTQENYVVVNGTQTSKTFNDGIAACGGWENLTFDIALNSGNNTLEIKKNWGYTEIDYINIGTLKSGSVTTDIQNQDNAGLRIYPNPVIDGQLNIIVNNNPDDSEFSLSDAYGKIRMTKKLYNGKNTIELNGIEKGFYIVRVIDNQNVAKTKIFIK
jgi:endoglucanase